jgi:DNA-binding CsgD family transcriptional regulator
MDVREILHQIRSGSSDRQVGRDLRIDRRTVKRYREWAQEQGLLVGELPELEIL